MVCWFVGWTSLLEWGRGEWWRGGEGYEKWNGMGNEKCNGFW